MGGAGHPGLRGQPARAPGVWPGSAQHLPRSVPIPPHHPALLGGQSPASSEERGLRRQCPRRVSWHGGRGYAGPSPPLHSPALALLPIAPTLNKHRHGHKRVCSHTHPHNRVTLGEAETGRRCSLSQDPCTHSPRGAPGTRRHTQRHVPRHGRDTEPTPTPAGTQTSHPGRPPAATATDAGAHVLSAVHPGGQAQTDTPHFRAAGILESRLAG